jgi:uncharacterized protein (TIGR02284 family)
LDLKEEVSDLSREVDGDGYHLNSRADIFASFNNAESDEDSVILAACKNADAAALQQYEEALAQRLPAPVRSVLEYQYRSIKQAYDQIKAWEKSGDSQ